MKIFDCVTFFEEKNLLDIRFNILNNYVDYFVVCEGLYNHKGKKKKKNFNIKRYSKFIKKIIYISCPKFPKNMNPWERQGYQRDYILGKLKIATDNDLILFSDPDEIPNPKKLKNINLKKNTEFFYKIFIIIN